jgi:hypothetical protein
MRDTTYGAAEFVGCRFRNNCLRNIEFRSLDLDDVHLPDAPELMLIEGKYAEIIRAVLAVTKGGRDKASVAIEVYFESPVKWKGRNQRRGVVDKVNRGTSRGIGSRKSTGRVRDRGCTGFPLDICKGFRC